MKNSVILFICVFFICACRNDNPPQFDQGVINVRLDRDPERINPIFASNNMTAREVYPYLFLQLAEFNPKTLELAPILAKSIPEEKEILDGEYKGGISYEFEILEDAEWVDGKPILASDYLFTLKVINHPDVNSPNWKNILGAISDVIIDENNPKKFTVIFKEAQLNTLTAASSFEFIPEHIYDEKGIMSSLTLQEIQNSENHDELKSKEGFSEFASTFNDVVFQQRICSGSGPYRLAQWETDQFVKLVRKENYWGDAYPDRVFLQSKPKEIIFNIIPDEVTAITQIKAGQIDLMTVMNGENYQQLKQENSELKYHSPQLTRYYFIAMNNSSPRLQDKKVRTALNHLLDVDAFIDQVEFGNAKRTVGFVLPFREEYNQSLHPLEYNETRAADLFMAAGWVDTDGNGILDKEILGKKEELIFDMYVTNGQLGKRLALLLSESCLKVGAKVNITQKDGRAILRDNIYTGKYDLYPMVTSGPLGESDPYSRWHSDNAENGGSNVARYRSPAADKLMMELRSEADDKKRELLYKKLQEQMYEDQPVIFLYSPVSKLVVSSNVDPLVSVKRPGYFLNTATVRTPVFSDN